jgi:dolichol-phosphate mannosyltransferase
MGCSGPERRRELVSMNLARLFTMLAVVQALAGIRVVLRLARTARGERITVTDAPLPSERVTVLVPVLNERARLGPCLSGLIAQPGEVAEILVVDGGSSDGTQDLVAVFAARDARVRLVDASPIPTGWNGKAHGLQVGLDVADPCSSWILIVDADVRLEPELVRSLLSHAIRTEVAATSIATTQELSEAAEGIVHPALLTTLVYRFGIPGHTTRRVAAVQANGQCALYRREPLEHSGGFAIARASVCEDVTVARALASNGYAVGFHESDGLASVTMYASWWDAWTNWTRSLPLRDRYSGRTGWLGLTEVALAQALPLPLLLVLRRSVPRQQFALTINGLLLLVRLGVLGGTARAYTWRPWTYWLSPLADLPAVVQLWRSALRRTHVWRGQILVREG